MSDLSQINFRAPERLVTWLKREGFAVELSLTRADRMTIDPGAEPPPADEAFTDLELKQIDGIVAAYDATEPWDAAGGTTEQPPDGGEGEEP